MTRAWLFALCAVTMLTVESRAQIGAPPAQAFPDNGAAAAAPGNGDGTTFRSGVDLVALNVVVTDPAQKFVNGLTADDFRVYEDGVQQDLAFFAATRTPLDLAVLLDTSASMSDKIQTEQQAAVGFVTTLHTGDRVSIVDIKDATRILQPLTDDLGSATSAILSTTARGGTALYNGIYLTLKELVKERRANGEVRRQAIVLFSDGDDTASLISFDDVMEVAKQSGVAIYTILLRSEPVGRQAALGGFRSFAQSEYSMKALAQETGARSFFPVHINELAGVFSSIAEELANQYALGYTPKNPKQDGAYRRVIVRVADRPGAQTRTRSGYVASRVATSTRGAAGSGRPKAAPTTNQQPAPANGQQPAATTGQPPAATGGQQPAPPTADQPATAGDQPPDQERSTTN